MGNKITPQIKIGTLGELLVQIRLLQFDVQAAAPLKDSGNDLIAVRGESFCGVQVKTSTKNEFQANNLPEHYHILALVNLQSNESDIFLDRSEVFLVPRNIVDKGGIPADLRPYQLNQQLIDNLF